MATTAVHTPSMHSVRLSYDPKDNRAVQFLASIRLLDFFRVEESPYDPVFVAKVKRAEKSKKHIVDVTEIWN